MIGTPNARKLHPVVESAARKATADSDTPTNSTLENSNHRGGRPPRLMAVAASLIVVAGVYLARDVLIPFTLAVLVSFLLGPLVGRLHRWGLVISLDAALGMLRQLAGQVRILREHEATRCVTSRLDGSLSGR